MVESAGKFNNFMVGKLSEEIRELRSDRKIQKENYQRLETFIVRALAGEIKEFAQDKQAVVETKVRLVAEAKQKLGDLQKQFIANSAKLVKEAVTTKLGTELTQLKEDIQLARENLFGRRIFEAFAGEFAVTHLNENKEIAKLQSAVERKERQLQEAKTIMEKTSMLVESKDKEIKIIKESQDRKAKLNDLLKPLNEEKSAVMRELLESVQTEKLQNAFEKYLPAVLNNSSAKKPAKAVLSENRSQVTGDKAAKVSASDQVTNVIDIKRLAGLK
jgi:predicted DNA-binding protein